MKCIKKSANFLVSYKYEMSLNRGYLLLFYLFQFVDAADLSAPSYIAIFVVIGWLLLTAIGGGIIAYLIRKKHRERALQAQENQKKEDIKSQERILELVDHSPAIYAKKNDKTRNSPNGTRPIQKKDNGVVIIDIPNSKGSLVKTIPPSLTETTNHTRTKSAHRVLEEPSTFYASLNSNNTTSNSNSPLLPHQNSSIQPQLVGRSSTIEAENNNDSSSRLPPLNIANSSDTSERKSRTPTTNNNNINSNSNKINVTNKSLLDKNLEVNTKKSITQNPNDFSDFDLDFHNGDTSISTQNNKNNKNTTRERNSHANSHPNKNNYLSNRDFEASDHNSNPDENEDFSNNKTRSSTRSIQFALNGSTSNSKERQKPIHTDRPPQQTSTRASTTEPSPLGTKPVTSATPPSIALTSIPTALRGVSPSNFAGSLDKPRSILKDSEPANNNANFLSINSGYASVDSKIRLPEEDTPIYDSIISNNNNGSQRSRQATGSGRVFFDSGSNRQVIFDGKEPAKKLRETSASPPGMTSKK